MEPQDMVEDFLAHYGVKGMKWGVRKDRTPGVPTKVDRDAKKDAKEFARAKMFYGTGAGNRRKLIRETVKAKSAKNADYKKAFDHHSKQQDLSTHASKAVKERKRTDRTEKGKQRLGYVARMTTGEMGTQAAFTAVAAAGVAYLNSPQGRAKMSSVASRVSNAAQNFTSSTRSSSQANDISDFLKRNGL